MTENKLIEMGKVSQFIAQFLRYTLIIILLVIAGIRTDGIGGLIIGVIFFKSIQKIISLKISIYSDFLDLTQQNIGTEVFKNQFRKKLIYNIVIFIIISLIVFMIRNLWLQFNTEYSILFFVLFLGLGIAICLLLFQFYYFKIVNDFVNLQKGSFSQNILSTNESNFEQIKKILRHIFDAIFWFIMIILATVCMIFIAELFMIVIASVIASFL